ncbi:gas1-like protein [Dactylellina haptotyla CBS 200.50]|uniref:Gas1-like protein n=2 Tax=Dactylellina haptotyla TaxID=430498 RepID=S8ARM4_DACHA|nr:Gas1-like protein [Dactylellina haptotyla]EPS45509.1 gas1-like protein [Dactylellina haptotyla CBS 200.50]
MHSKLIVSAFVAIVAMAPAVSAHGLILKATGDAGSASSKALGVDDSVPRDGTRRNPFQTDTTRFANQRTVDAANGCGSTIKGGKNDIATFQGTMAQVSAGGTVSMTLHQVNADGAGPYTCMVDASGTGNNFVQMQVTTQIPGTRGSNRATQKQDLPLVAQMPAGVQCTGTVGGQNNVCMVRCQNNARAGPFGGCVPVQMVGANGGGNQVGGGNQNTGNQNTGNQNTGNQNGGNTGTNGTTLQGIAGRRFRRGVKVIL